MRKKIIVVVLWLLLVPLASAAQGKPYRVGILLPGDQWASSVDGFKEGMKALRYVEGQDVHYLFENAKGDKKKVAQLTKKFVDEKVDVIYTITNTALKIVAEVSRPSRTPVVFGSASGPVESGIQPGYATPNTHITGVTSGSIELVAKRLEILKEALPSAKRVAVIGDLEADSSKTAFAIAEKTASQLGLALVEFRVKSKEEAIETAKKLTRKEADALLLIPRLAAVGSIGEIALAAKSARLPFAVYQVEHVKRNGALLSYGSSYYLQGKQSALLVDKILRGTPPHQLPIERPNLHELILNLDTAKEIGIRFAPEMINRADELVGGGNTR